MSLAGPVEDVGGLADPLVGHPLGAEEDWAAAVEHGHVRAAGPLDVVPEHGRALGRRHGHAQPREGGVAPPRDLKPKIRT